MAPVASQAHRSERTRWQLCSRKSLPNQKYAVFTRAGDIVILDNLHVWHDLPTGTTGGSAGGILALGNGATANVQRFTIFSRIAARRN